MRNIGSDNELTAEQIAMHIEVAMAADSRQVPILRGKHAPIDAVERDRLRSDFAEWLAGRILAANLRVIAGPPAAHGAFPRGYSSWYAAAASDLLVIVLRSAAVSAVAQRPFDRSRNALQQSDDTWSILTLQIVAKQRQWLRHS